MRKDHTLYLIVHHRFRKAQYSSTHLRYINEFRLALRICKHCCLILTLEITLNLRGRNKNELLINEQLKYYKKSKLGPCLKLLLSFNRNIITEVSSLYYPGELIGKQSVATYLPIQN